MIRTVLLLALFGTALAFSVTRQHKSHKRPHYCYATDDNRYLFTATKTPYETVRGGDENANNTLLSECTPRQFWSFNRHGTRLPGKKAIRALRNLTELQQQVLDNYEQNEIEQYESAFALCDEDVALLRNWTWNSNITEAVGSHLVEEGWSELRNMARRNAERFPELLGLDYSEQDYLFRYTETQRTEASFRAYAEGLFGSYDNITAQSYENDTLLEAYKHCPYWDTEVDTNASTIQEYTEFVQSHDYQQLISEVSARLGFHDLLDADTIQDVYDMCRFQQAWNPDLPSPWCAAFAHSHLRMLEYAEDLQYYYGLGHGIALNRQMGCMPLQDMLTRFQNVINGSASEPSSVHYYSHSAALQLLLVSMGMFQDDVPLTAENYEEQQDRVWRTSLIGPFAANINAVLYQCGDSDYNVVFYNNERVYEFPDCDAGVCSWEVVRKRFSQLAESCSLDFCQNV